MELSLAIGSRVSTLTIGKPRQPEQPAGQTVISPTRPRPTVVPTAPPSSDPDSWDQSLAERYDRGEVAPGRYDGRCDILDSDQ